VTGALPTSVSAAITFWVSDPAWHVAPELDVGQHSWLVTLSTQQGSSFGVSHPDAQAVVVLRGNGELSDPHPACLLLDVGLNCSRPMSAAPPGSYHFIQVPRQQAYPYIGRVFLAISPGTRGLQFRRRFFRVTAWDFYATGPDRSVFPVSGQASPIMEGATSTCQAPTIELFTGAGQRFSDSTVAPTSMDNGIATWTQQRGTSGNITPLFAGVLAGIAGGLLAGWLAAGVTFLVKRATAPGTRAAGERPSPGPAA
jgi:hypothetical protein